MELVRVTHREDQRMEASITMSPERVFLDIHPTAGVGTIVHYRLTHDQAREIGQALLDAANELEPWHSP